MKHEPNEMTSARGSSILVQAVAERLRLGELLRSAKRISPEQLDAALAAQRSRGGKLGDIVVGLGMATREDCDVCLEFQSRQSVAATASAELRLGSIMVRSGDITPEQLGATLAQQDQNGGLLGTLLIAAGHSSIKQVAAGLLKQKELVAKALIAAMLVAAPLALIVPPVSAGQASANLQVSAFVVAGARLQTHYQAAQLTLTKDDIAKGYIDVFAASRFSVKSNSRAGFQINFYPVGEVFQGVQINGMDHPAKFGGDGGTVVQRGAMTYDRSYELSYRFVLGPDLQPGRYLWPLVLSVRAL